MEKAAELSADADLLDEIAQTGFNGSSLVIANSYREIVNTMNEADEAANTALMVRV